ncbi:class I SAM-dependent methyltransferase [Candidatus Omnitrophota bacterium]
MHIVDDQSIIKDSTNYYKDVIKRISLSNKIKRRFIIQESISVKRLEFPDNHFDKVSCLSTIEHIRDDGDIMMMKEIFRVLKKEGLAVITFPFNSGGYIEEENPEGIGYFQRTYNIAEIKRRIIDSTHLNVDKVIYFGERYARFGRFYLKNRNKSLNWLFTFLNPFLWQIKHSYCGEFHDFHENEIEKENIGAAILILRK